MPTRRIVEPHIDPTDREATRQTNPVYGVGTTLASFWLCAVVVVELIAAMLAMTLVVPLFKPIFEEFDAELPTATAWLLSVPPMATFIAMLTLIILVLAKEFVIPNRQLTLAINGLLLLASFLWIPFLVTALFQPLVALMESVM